jgi:predicted RNase H-like nuclease (RuvC/YqgF family)
LDNEAILEQFEKIEQKVETLIKANQSLEAANLELKAKTEKLETELQQVKASEGRNDEIKSLIRAKIDSLMERLDGVTEAEA